MACMLCVEYEKGKMTSRETLANIGEMIDSTDDEEKKAHLFELADKVITKDMPFDEFDEDFGPLSDLNFMPDED